MKEEAKQEKRQESARRGFRAASAAWMLRHVDPVGRDAAAFEYEMYCWCQTMPPKARHAQQ